MRMMKRWSKFDYKFRGRFELHWLHWLEERGKSIWKAHDCCLVSHVDLVYSATGLEIGISQILGSFREDKTVFDVICDSLLANLFC